MGEQIFLTSKMPPGDRNAAMKYADQILEELNVSYVDLLLIHTPAPNLTQNLEQYKALLELQLAGKARAVGISNFCINQTKSILEANVPIPAVNQFEFQPYWHKADWVAYNQQHNIVVNGAAPLGGPDVAPFRDNWNSSILQLPAVTTIASTHNCTPAQVILSWEY